MKHDSQRDHTQTDSSANVVKDDDASQLKSVKFDPLQCQNP